MYDSKDCKLLKIVSSKTTLRERIAQTALLERKIKQSGATKNTKTLFAILEKTEI